MEWKNQAIILGTKKFGESNCILEVMTREYGRHLGLVYGGSTRNKRYMLQPGNLIEVKWRARLADHLGCFSVEPTHLRAANLINLPHAVLGIQVMACLMRLLPERDPHPLLYDALAIILDNIDDPMSVGATIVRFELELLKELGFGLDLSKCAATGEIEELVWVSPKSGKAVSKAAGEPYTNVLLPLPPFLRPNSRNISVSAEMIEQAFVLTSYFLSQRIYQPRGLNWPEEKERFINVLLATLK